MQSAENVEYRLGFWKPSVLDHTCNSPQIEKWNDGHFRLSKHRIGHETVLACLLILALLVCWHTTSTAVTLSSAALCIWLSSVSLHQCGTQKWTTESTLYCLPDCLVYRASCLWRHQPWPSRRLTSSRKSTAAHVITTQYSKPLSCLKWLLPCRLRASPLYPLPVRPSL